VLKFKDQMVKIK